MNKNNLKPPPIATQELRREPHRYDLIVTDFILLNLSFLLSSWLLYEDFDTDDMFARHLPLVFFVNTIWLGLTIHYEAYRWYEKVRIEAQLGKILKMLAFHFALICIFYYQVLYRAPTSGYLWLTYTLAAGSICTGRAIHHLRMRGKGQPFRYIIVGGEKENLHALVEAFQHSFSGSAQLVGRFGNTKHEGFNQLGSYNDIKQYLLGKPAIDKVIWFYNQLPIEEKRELLAICSNQFISVEIAPREASVFPRGYKGQQHGDMFILTLKQEPLTLLRNKLVKRTFDLFFSGGVILFTFPILLPVVAFLIKRESKGPVFFVQERSGYHNQQFSMIKFRTMTVNDQADDKQATIGDARVTKIGAFLRKTSLDEFPQFLNVFMGDMSVVGPRPHMLKHTEQYSAIIDTYMIRHKIKPGVTGWAQVNGYRGPTDEDWKMKKRVEFDVRYLENWSLPLDIRCIILTVVNAIRGEENAL